MPGVIKLATNGMQVDRMGKTGLLQITSFVRIPVPGMKLETVHTKFAFEVAELNSSRYVIIVGNDLWRRFFPSIPGEYTGGNNANRTVSLENECKVNSGDGDMNVNAMNILPVLLPSMNDLRQDGLVGTALVNEFPKRHSLETEPGLEEVYTKNRNQVLLHAEPLLIINRAITGFCNLPQCVVILDVDPVKRDRLFRKQYKIPESAKPAVSACVSRWLKEDRIELAPTGCPFNNPLTVAPKKDEHGELVGIRVCLDVRALNDALLDQDRFQLPLISEILESFAGKSIFGELDLQEAYLPISAA